LIGGAEGGFFRVVSVAVRIRLSSRYGPMCIAQLSVQTCGPGVTFIDARWQLPKCPRPASLKQLKRGTVGQKAQRIGVHFN
jgi:hypothetical protein